METGADVAGVRNSRGWSRLDHAETAHYETFRLQLHASRWICGAAAVWVARVPPSSDSGNVRGGWFHPRWP